MRPNRIKINFSTRQIERAGDPANGSTKLTHSRPERHHRIRFIERGSAQPIKQDLMAKASMAEAEQAHEPRSVRH
jgi:hypothetical protein